MKESGKFYTVRGYQLLNQDSNLLTSSMEDYVEMIYRCSLSTEYVRINTLSNLLNVSPPSATNMVKKLKKFGLVTYEKYGTIYLTQNGDEIGKFLLARHKTIETFLKNLGVKDNVLSQTELIEHSITAETLQRFEALNDFFNSNPEIFLQFNK